MPERVKREHLAAIAALEARVFHAPWSEEALALLLSDTAFGYAVVEEGEALCYGGMLTVLDEGQITNVATHPAHRRRGFAARVMEALLDEARKRGLATVTLEVRASNEAAIALYRRYGFAVLGKRPRFYTHPVEDALIMGAALDGKDGE